MPEDRAGAGPHSPAAGEDTGNTGNRVSTGNWGNALEFLLRRGIGDYAVDDFGFDRELTDAVLLPALRPLFDRWFRTEVTGIENLPSDGPALVVANHSGTIAIDAAMAAVAVHDQHPRHRHLRMLGADVLFGLPFAGDLARRFGTVPACAADTDRLLAGGHLVGVWPEGFKGVGKKIGDRYQLQRFGRGGFAAAALRAGAPIVPCSIVGAEEAYPMVGSSRLLGRVLGLPYFPITPTFPWLGALGAVPLPSKWLIEFGPPIETAQYGAAAAEDQMTVLTLTDQVREQVQQDVYRLLGRRRTPFW
jgi:1-acyl-sn-glycerol-3-phosphate acyltransferase